MAESLKDNDDDTLYKVGEVKPIGATYLAQVLKAHGVKFIFTLSGSSIISILAEVDKVGIRIIDTRHEHTAVNAARAVGRLTGVAGVGLVTTGPGVTNTISALQEAKDDEVPLILIGGGIPLAAKNIGYLHDMDQISILNNVCKKTFTVMSSEEIIPILKKAFQLSASGRPGPIFIEMPEDVLAPFELTGNYIEFEEALYDSTSVRKIPQVNSQDTSPLKVTYPIAGNYQVVDSAKLIMASKKPLIILGTQVTLRPKQLDEVSSALIEEIGIPCLTFGESQGILGKSNKLHIRNNPSYKKAMGEADLIILAGKTCDWDINYLRDISSKTKIIIINRAKRQLYIGSPTLWKPTLAIKSDVGHFLLRLGVELEKNSYKCSSSWINKLRKMDDDYYAMTLQQAQEQGPGPYLNPLQIALSLENSIGSSSNDIMWVIDQGYFTLVDLPRGLRPAGPLSFLGSGRSRCVGSSAGLALGAKCIYPNRQVWVVQGDGSAGYTIMEHDTFSRHKIPIATVIANNAQWGDVTFNEVKEYGTDVGTELQYSKYHEVAKVFDALGYLVDTKISPDELEQTFTHGQELHVASSKCVCINVFMNKVI